MCNATAGALQISYSDKKPGIMPWSGQGESWVCWRYPFRRQVATVLITLPPKLLSLVDLELLAFSEETGCFELVTGSTRAIADARMPGGENFEEALLLCVEVNLLIAFDSEKRG